jgi:glutamine amidotransferase
MLVTIVDYGSGNLRSAAKAFERVAGNNKIKVTNNPQDLNDATHIVLPGVGAYDDCMRGLEAVSGMREALEKNVREKHKPFLGICVGMQMLFDTGHENGIHKGLGWIEGEVVKIGSRGQGSGFSTSSRPPTPEPRALKVPHMGWNTLTIPKPHPLLACIQNGDHVYFVHSYHALCKDKTNVIATTEYGVPITAIVAKGNIMGTQFHPEKSQQTGLRLIENFLTMQFDDKHQS